MHLDDGTVCPRSDAGKSQGWHQITLAGRMGRINEHGQVRPLLKDRHG
jgi:hypothetical protein